MRQEGTLTGEHLPNKAIQLFSKGAYPFFVWHIIRNSLKLFPILSFPVLSHDTAEDWEDHVEITYHKVTDLHRSNPARTQATENIPQTGDGVQGGHAADGNPDSVKVASQALVGWKFLQLMFVWLWILLALSIRYWSCPGTYCSAGSHAVCNAKKETAKTKNGCFLVAGNLKQRTAFQRWTCWSQRCFENLEGEKTQRSLCNWVWERLLLAWRHPNFGRLQTKIAMSKVSTGKRLILFFELSLFWSQSWAQRFNQIYAWSTGSSWIGGLAKVWVLFTVLSSWALLSIMTGVVSDNMLEVGSSWNIMEPHGCEMMRWWDDHVSCFFSSFEIKNFHRFANSKRGKTRKRQSAFARVPRWSKMSWQQSVCFWQDVDMLQNSNEDYKWPSHLVKYSSQLAKMASWKSRRFQNLRSKQWLLNMLWHVVTVIACIVRVFPRPARTLLRWCLPPISSGSCRVLQTCCNLSAFDSFAWHAW